MSSLGKGLILALCLVACLSPVFAVDAELDLHHRTHHRHRQVTSSDAGSAGSAVGSSYGSGSGDDEFSPCKTCVFVVERVKKGTNMLLPAICSELFVNYPDSFSSCHQVLDALAVNGNNVKYWLFEGCYKYEVYNAREWIKPCPSHVMCSVMLDLDGDSFCPKMPMEDPFEFEAAMMSSGSGSGSFGSGSYGSQ